MENVIALSLISDNSARSAAGSLCLRVWSQYSPLCLEMVVLNFYCYQVGADAKVHVRNPTRGKM